MRIAFDTNALVALETAPEGSDLRAKVDWLIEEVGRSKGKLVIPAPAWAEFLVKAPPETVDLLTAKRFVEIAPFDQAAAAEWAEIRRTSPDGRRGRKKAGETNVKASFDDQVVAIAKVRGCETLYSHDARVRDKARAAGMNGDWIDDLPLPDAARQRPLDLPNPDTDESC